MLKSSSGAHDLLAEVPEERKEQEDDLGRNSTMNTERVRVRPEGPLGASSQEENLQPGTRHGIQEPRDTEQTSKASEGEKKPHIKDGD